MTVLCNNGSRIQGKFSLTMSYFCIFMLVCWLPETCGSAYNVESVKNSTDMSNTGPAKVVADSVKITSTDHTECTRRCLMKDTTPDCWQKSLDFFTAQVQRSVRDYAAVLVLMHRWRAATTVPELTANVTNLEDRALDKVLGEFAQLDEKERGPLSTDDVQAVMTLLINKTSSHYPHYLSPHTYPPSAACPVPCDYYPAVWTRFCYVLVACLVLQSVTFFLYTCYSSKRIDKLGRL